jgi:hypothetical protein
LNNLNSNIGHNSELIYKLTVLLAIFIYFQQVFVINIGGSFKIFDLITLIITLWFVIYSDFKIYSIQSLILFLFFCFFSGLGYFYFYLEDDILNYYVRFPEAAKVLRFNQIYSQIMTFIYCIFTWTCINAIAGSKLVFLSREKIYKYFVVTGTFISVYALYGMVFVGGMGMPDIVPDVFDYRNSQPEDYALRTIGFSSEPGQLAPILSWTVLYAYYANKIFTKYTRIIVLWVTSLALFFTFSSSLLALLFSWCLFIIIFSGNWARIRLFLTVLTCIYIIILMANYFEFIDLLEYFFIGKFLEFIDPSSAIGNNSGLQRSFTSLLGLEVFKSFPIFGVGAGNSYFFLHSHENNIGIWSDMLTYSTPPQNTHSMILAETGAVGYFIFIIFYITTIWVSVKEYIKTRDKMLKAHIIGTLAQFGFLFSVFPVYSIYHWFNISLLLNKIVFLKFYDKNNS